ncbi:flagellar hook-length control protein FliK [Geobacter sp. OR-1]|uniref:flagellar hook-length control protein FliK n=1 Tax=Geobacter sp. OR-1 TaxID=1266765 RepID=UPI0005439648|nr:flagellar hook-length control protein FliK [Geobacter sp. OR-1]GAM09693.1 flagellar hook-length control protein FliK [Geobacter sp. OR-1]
MDVMTLMMSSMTQSPVMPATANGPFGQLGQPGQPGDSSGKSLLFATLLGTSLQDQLPVFTQQAVAEGDQTANIKALMALLSESPATGTETAEFTATGMAAGQEGKALSIMQLLTELKSRLEGSSEALNQQLKGGRPVADVEQLIAQLRTLIGQEGTEIPEPAVTLPEGAGQQALKSESLLERLTQEAIDSKPDEQGADGQRAALLAIINGMLAQVPRQTPEQKLEKGDGEGETPVALPVIVARTQGNEKSQLPESLGAEDKAGQSQPGTSMESFVVPETKNVGNTTEVHPKYVEAQNAADTAVKELQPKTVMAQNAADTAVPEQQPKYVKAQNAAVQIHPAAVPSPVVEEAPAVQAQNHLDSAAIEVVVREEASVQELVKPAVAKLEPETAAKHEQSRAEAIFVLAADGKQQASADSAVAEDARKPVSSEQIVSQVREKLAEHRVMQENGQVTIRLNPAELGELKISVRMEDQRLRVEIVAENRTVKDALMENLGSLKESLARQNIEMKQFDVSTGNRQFFNQGFREGRQQEQQYVAPRQSGWLMGRTAELDQSGPVAWQSRGDALLDMMM